MYDFSTEETYQDGQIVYEEGSTGDWIYVIESGAVELSKKRGEEKVVVDILGPGDVFGEISFVAGVHRTVTAKVIGTTMLKGIDRSLLEQEFNKASGTFRMILKSLAFRLDKATEKATQGKLRREEPRVNKVLSLDYETSEGFIEAFSGDMSVKGLFIKTSKPLAKGDRFILKLQLPDASEALMMDCIVSWNRVDTNDPERRPNGMGVKFADVSTENRQMLKEELMKTVSNSIFRTF